MGSTGESDRKRRHFSSVGSPTAATMAKKHPFSHASDDKKHNITVLQFQNKKLMQKLEAQKVEYTELENKLSQKKERQKSYESILNAVSNSWETLVNDVEKCSNRIKKSNDDQDNKYASISVDVGSSSPEDAFVSRLMETGATECSCTSSGQDMMEEDRETTSEKIKNIIQNISGAISGILHLNNGLHSAVLKGISEDGACRQKITSELQAEVKKLRLSFSDLHLKHRLLAPQLQNHRDNNAKDKAELSRLKGESEIAVAELKDCRFQVATLKAERDSTQGTFFPVLSMGNKHVAGEKAREKQKNLEDMHSAVKELLDQSSSRLQELNGLHEQRIKTLQQLSDLQRSLKNVKCLSSSQPYLLVMEQLDTAKSELFRCQALFEKLQIEKNNLVWREKELNMKNDLVDVLRRYSAVADSKVTDLKSDIQKQIDDRKLIETKLDEASEEPGRKGIIVDFKALLSSFPEEMGSMQRQLSNYKEEASDIHSLQADVQSLTSVLDRKTKETENLLARSSNQAAEIQKFKSVVDDLKKGEQELKLFLDMYKRESTDSRDDLEAKDLEYRSWAKVQSLTSSLDEKTLELRVKTANEAEARSQQQLAAAEAEIADLRQRLDVSRRDLSKLSQSLKAKSDENEAYLSEIETIGQAYDDMQTQNQHLLQQVTERDDYNVKLILEGTRARQQQDYLIFNNHRMGREIKQANISLDFYGVKAARIEDQLKVCSEQSHKLADAKFQNSVALDTTQKKLADVRRSSDQARELLEDTQLKVDKSRSTLLEMQIDIEKERFKKRRIEEEIAVAKRKISSLRREIEGSSIVQKLQQELQKYREIVKCSICCDTPKQVVITRCYHLFCNTCVQKLIGSRQRKCPACSASFGPNDVKSVYI